jgi:hypothetical protein
MHFCAVPPRYPCHELDAIEPAYQPSGMSFPGLLLLEFNLEEALVMALAWTEIHNTLWTDGSCLEDGNVGCGMVWKDNRGRWQGKSVYLGRNKEVFDTELRAIYKATARFSCTVTPRCRYTIFTDVQAAIQRCASNFARPGQYLARLIIEKPRVIVHAGSSIDIQWFRVINASREMKKPINSHKKKTWS